MSRFDWRRYRILMCLSGVSFMIVLDSNIVSMALPSIGRDLHAAFHQIEWVISSYVLTFATCLLPSGSLADRYGRRMLLLIGLSLFTAASLACGLASSAEILNLSRAAQGVGAALQLSAALASLGHEFQGSERAKAFGFWGTILGVAVMAGPILGGVIVAALGWRWTFFVNLPVAMVLMILTLRHIKESSDPDSQALDIAGMVVFGTALFFLVWALIDGNVDGWTSGSILAKLAAAFIGFALFAVIERGQIRPMLDLELFRSSAFVGASVAMFGYAASAQVMVTYLPLYLQSVFEFRPADAGMAMMPYAMPLLVFPKVGARLATRLSSRYLLTIGLSLVAVGNLVTGVMATLHTPFVMVAFGMALTGSGAGLLNGETVKTIMNAVSSERSGMASGIGSSLRFVGIVLGFTILGAILHKGASQRFAEMTASLPQRIASQIDAPSILSRILAGDAEILISTVDPMLQAQFRETCRLSFEAGFASLLFAATLIACIGAVVTFRLIGTKGAAPRRERQ
jgi:EmrB/QacA subfamily drug resistance transporter